MLYRQNQEHIKKKIIDVGMALGLVALGLYTTASRSEDENANVVQAVGAGILENGHINTYMFAFRETPPSNQEKENDTIYDATDQQVKECQSIKKISSDVELCIVPKYSGNTYLRITDGQRTKFNLSNLIHRP